ncbi:MAG: hypothetical protein MAG451_02628 [Anaerolineales bacterium]|nr:hypothetical protein [Anaerolineales bacterium]
MRPDRQVDFSQQPLQEDKRGFLTDPTAGFMALGDQTVDAGLLTPWGVLGRGALQHDLEIQSMEHLNLLAQVFNGRRSQDYDLNQLRQAGGHAGDKIVSPAIKLDAARLLGVAGHLGDGIASGCLILGML